MVAGTIGGLPNPSVFRESAVTPLDALRIAEIVIELVTP